MQIPLGLLALLMHMIEIYFFYITSEGLHYNIIWSNIGRATLGRNYDFAIGKAACEGSGATWNLGANSAFALGSRTHTEKLDRVGRSQDLPDVTWLLASSPALNTRTLTLLPTWLLFYLKNKFTYFFTDRCFYMHILDRHQTNVFNIFEENTCLYFPLTRYIQYRKRRVQQCLYFCIHCRCNTFT
jgi:hypothetical protein